MREVIVRQSAYVAPPIDRAMAAYSRAPHLRQGTSFRGHWAILDSPRRHPIVQTPSPYLYMYGPNAPILPLPSGRPWRPPFELCVVVANTLLAVFSLARTHGDSAMCSRSSCLSTESSRCRPPSASFRNRLEGIEIIPAIACSIITTSYMLEAELSRQNVRSNLSSRQLAA